MEDRRKKMKADESRVKEGEVGTEEGTQVRRTTCGKWNVNRLV